MPHKQPPIKTRFPVNRPAKPHTQKHPNGYLLPLIKKFLNKTITYDDPETQKKITGKVKDAVIWRLLLNACQGENQAIKEILDRIDGKVVQELKGDFKATYAKISIIRNYTKEEDARKQEDLQFNAEADQGR